MSFSKKTFITVLVLGVSILHADVLVDNMSGIANKTSAGGYVFDISSEATTWEWPDPALSWSYLDFEDFGLDDTGKVARVAGTLGGAVDYPFIGWGCFLNLGKDTLDLSENVSAFAFRARGVGNWRFKFRNKLIDELAPEAGKTGDQVAWRVQIPVTEEWQWFVFTPEQFSANVGDVNTLFAQSYTAKDPMKSIYKVYWQSDGYTSADQGTEVWLDVDDFFLLGSISEIGMSTIQPSEQQCSEINAVAPGACASSSIRHFRTPAGLKRSSISPDAKLFSVTGEAIGNAQRSGVRLPEGVYIINAEGANVLRTNLTR